MQIKRIAILFAILRKAVHYVLDVVPDFKMQYTKLTNVVPEFIKRYTKFTNVRAMLF